MGLKKSSASQPAAEVQKETDAVETAEVVEVAEQEETVDVTEVESVEEESVVASTELAADASTSKAVAVSAGGGQMSTQLAEMGFEGLEGGFFSQINLKINNGAFETSEGDELEEKAFQCQILETRAKFSFSTGNTEDDEAVYSYDGTTAVDGTDLNAQFREWVAEGLLDSVDGVQKKQYVDAVLQVLDGSLEGEIVVASIAPSSVQKLFGYMRGLVYKQLDLKSVVTEISVGKTVKPSKSPKNSYNPWAFKFVKTL